MTIQFQLINAVNIGITDINKSGYLYLVLILKIYFGKSLKSVFSNEYSSKTTDNWLVEWDCGVR